MFFRVGWTKHGSPGSQVHPPQTHTHTRNAVRAPNTRTLHTVSPVSEILLATLVDTQNLGETSSGLRNRHVYRTFEVKRALVSKGLWFSWFVRSLLDLSIRARKI